MSVPVPRPRLSLHRLPHLAPQRLLLRRRQHAKSSRGPHVHGRSRALDAIRDLRQRRAHRRHQLLAHPSSHLRQRQSRLLLRPERAHLEQRSSPFRFPRVFYRERVRAAPRAPGVDEDDVRRRSRARRRSPLVRQRRQRRRHQRAQREEHRRPVEADATAPRRRARRRRVRRETARGG